MLFRGWKPKANKRNSFVRFYVVNKEGEFIGEGNKKLFINASTEARKTEIYNSLLGNGIDINIYDNTQELEGKLESRGLLINLVKPKFKSNIKKEITDTNLDNQENYTYKNDEQIELEANNLCIEKTPFRNETRLNTFIQVDDREPIALFETLQKNGLSISKTRLIDGSVVIKSKQDNNKKLVIVRMTASELRAAIMGKEKRAYLKAEKYYKSIQEYQNEGGLMQVVWLIESDMKNGNKQNLLNSMETLEDFSSWYNYISVICNQQLIETFNITHTAFLISTLTQGFTEQELYFPIKVGKRRIDRTAKERKKLKKKIKVINTPNGSIGDDLVSLLSLIPGINSNIAIALAKTGKTFSQITNLSQEELQYIPGIGPKNSIVIFCTFNQSAK